MSKSPENYSTQTSIEINKVSTTEPSWKTFLLYQLQQSVSHRMKHFIQQDKLRTLRRNLDKHPEL